LQNEANVGGVRKNEPIWAGRIAPVGWIYKTKPIGSRKGAKTQRFWGEEFCKTKPIRARRAGRVGLQNGANMGGDEKAKPNRLRSWREELFSAADERR